MSDEQQSPIAFDVWWREEALPRLTDRGFLIDDDLVEMARLHCRIAWQRGAYHAMTGNLTPPTH